MTDIPTAIQRFVDTTNAGDPNAFVAVFTDDATLDDWGHVVHGREGIAGWDRTDNIGNRSHFDIRSIEQTGPDTYLASLTVTGDGHNGTGPMEFVVHGDLIRSLKILPT